jgi:hypothetical protein
MATKQTIKSNPVALAQFNEPIARGIAIIEGRESANVALAHWVFQVAPSVKKAVKKTGANQRTLADAVSIFAKQLQAGILASQVLSEASAKVEVSRVRSVLSAVCEGRLTKHNGENLRQLYELTKGSASAGKGGRPTGARTIAGPQQSKGDGAQKQVANTPVAPIDPDALKREAVQVLFGEHDDELLAAIEWAVSNRKEFIGMVAAQILAAQQAKKPARKRPVKKPEALRMAA